MELIKLTDHALSGRLSVAAHLRLGLLTESHALRHQCILLRLRRRDHVSAVQISHDRLRISHISKVLSACQLHMTATGGQAADASGHPFVLHPLWIDCPPLHFSFFARLKNCGVHIEGLLTIAVMLAAEALTLVFTAAFFLTFPVAVRVVVVARMLAKTLEVLRAD